MTELRHGTPAEAGLDAARLDLARERCARWVADGHTPSLVVLAARNGVIALHEAFGQRSPAGDPLRKDSIYPVLSVSKPLTATAVLALVEDGLLGLNRPVSSYLPEFTGEGKDVVLVAHLLSHISGFQDVAVDEHAVAVAGADGFDPGPTPADSDPVLHAYQAARWSAPLVHQPGQQMEYCNYNYELLGEIVRRVSGSGLDEYSRERIFAPLGMNDTGFRLRDEQRPRVVERALRLPGAAPLPPWFPGIESDVLRDTPFGAAGAYSTAFDLAIFLQMLLGSGTYGTTRVLSRPTVEAATRNQNPGIGGEFPPGVWHPEAAYGYGWLVEASEKWAWAHGSLVSPGTFHHQGAFGAYAWADPATGVLGVWLGVTLQISANLEQFWNADLFQNLISAAVLP